MGLIIARTPPKIAQRGVTQAYNIQQYSSAHQPEGHPHTDDWMSSYQLPGRQSESLGGRILRHVGWLVDDVKTLEMDPHWMGGIRQAPVRKCIGREQVAKLIVHTRFADAHYQPNSNAPQESDESY